MHNLIDQEHYFLKIRALLPTFLPPCLKNVLANRLGVFEISREKKVAGTLKVPATKKPKQRLAVSAPYRIIQFRMKWTNINL